MFWYRVYMVSYDTPVFFSYYYLVINYHWGTLVHFFGPSPTPLEEKRLNVHY